MTQMHFNHKTKLEVPLYAIMDGHPPTEIGIK